MLIEPFTAANYGTGGKWAVNTTNFTGSKSFFQCSETSGTTLTDNIGGAVYTPLATTLTFVTNGVALGVNTTQSLTSGSITNIGTSNFIVFAIAQFAAATGVIGYGDVTGGTTPCVGVYSTGGVFRSYVYDGTTAIDTSTLIASDTTTVHTFAVKGVWTGGNLVVTNFVDSTNTPQASASTAMNSFAWNSSKYLSIKSLTKLYSLSLYLPSTMPSNAQVQEMLAWINYQHVTNGNKYIYPTLKSL